MSTAPSDSLSTAFGFYQAGQFAQAADLCAAILRAQPDHLAALQILCAVKVAQGLLLEALELNTRTLALSPDDPERHNERGVLLAMLNRAPEAVASFDAALRLKPDYADVFNNRGNALKSLRRYEEALASYDRALALRPRYPEALNNRGVTLHELKRCAEAIESFDQAIALNGTYLDAITNRGTALLALDRLDEALASYDEALALKPDFVKALNNRGNALGALGRAEEALASYGQALAIRPDYAEALFNRANVLQQLGRLDDALAGYQNAIASDPTYIEALNNRGLTLTKLGRHDEALLEYEKTLALQPDYVPGLTNSGLALDRLGRYAEAMARHDRAVLIGPDSIEALYNRGLALKNLARFEAAAVDLDRVIALDPDYLSAKSEALHCKMQCCDWRSFAADVADLAQAVRAGKDVCDPFRFLSISSSPADQLTCTATFLRTRRPSSAPLRQAGKYDHPKIRIAYLSADFYNHATAYLMAGLFERHDRARFSTTAISYGPDIGRAMRARLENAFDTFIDVRKKDDREVAELLRSMEIDIAVDLKGYTQHSRHQILAYRPAPVQATYLGYPGTLAADYIDYAIADATVIPTEHEPYYSEKIVRLPDSYQVTDSARPIAARGPTRAQAGLPESGVVFCSFNANYKITPAVFEIWTRLLRRVDGSVLWLYDSNAAVARNLRARAAAQGVAPERLVFAAYAEQADHLARHRLADLFLDTLPYNAHTTASDALWAGVPVLTCLGTTFAGRVAASVLRAAGLPELVTESLADYEALAFKLATAPGRLAGLKKRLQDTRRTMPLFDTDRFRRHIEAAYETMWQRHQRGEAVQSFDVDVIG